MSLPARDGDGESGGQTFGGLAPARAARGLRRVRANGAWTASRVCRADGDGDCANSNRYAYALPYSCPNHYAHSNGDPYPSARGVPHGN